MRKYIFKDAGEPTDGLINTGDFPELLLWWGETWLLRILRIFFFCEGAERLCDIQMIQACDETNKVFG